MTENSVPRMKSRNGARLFKNPPQPHMCIQDFIQGTTAPCYVNVLSWDKIAMPRRPSLPVPLYGGMRVPPPRTKTEAIVFAVMANPEVLRISGKNAQDAKKRTSFIELLLDFIEAMNAGIVFNRNYTILKDRDITGELKEVWNAVLAIRDNEQRPPQQETWIDVQPPMLFPQYPEQQQQQQQQEYVPQPPQYHSSVTYGRIINNENMHYENYGPQNPVLAGKNEPIFISGHIVAQHSPNNVRQIAFDQRTDNYHERGRDQVMQNIIAAQHQFQPRQTWPQYVNTKYMHPNSNLPYGPAANTTPPINTPNQMKPFQPYTTYQQQQLQPQQSQIHFNHVQSQYAEQSGPFNVQNNAQRASRPHMGVAQKNNATKRQANSSTYISCTNCQNREEQSFTKPKSPVKVLQREMLTERQDTTNHAENKTPAEKTEEPKTVPMTNLDEDLKKSDELVVNTYPEKEDICSSELARTVDEAPSSEEKNSVKLESNKMPLMETKETDVPVTQQLTFQKANKFIRGNARTRRAHMTKDDKHNSSESPKRSQPTVNSIIKSVFKINPGGASEESSSKKKANSPARPANGKAMYENEEQIQQGYTILKKEAQEEMVSEIAQLSIQDCKDVTEVAPVLS